MAHERSGIVVLIFTRPSGRDVLCEHVRGEASTDIVHCLISVAFYRNFRNLVIMFKGISYNISDMFANKLNLTPVYF